MHKTIPATLLAACVFSAQAQAQVQDEAARGGLHEARETLPRDESARVLTPEHPVYRIDVKDLQDVPIVKARASDPEDQRIDVGDFLTELSTSRATGDAGLDMQIRSSDPALVFLSVAGSNPDSAVPVVRLCNAPDSFMPVGLTIFARSSNAPAVPSETVRLDAGTCIFASGQRIEAFLPENAVATQAKAMTWMDQRIESLRVEAQSLTDSRAIEVNRTIREELEFRAAAMRTATPFARLSVDIDKR